MDDASQLPGCGVPARREPGAAAAVRAANIAARRGVAVLDDDPTGSQSVHDVDIFTDPGDLAELSRRLAEPGNVSFVLTNSRSLGAAAATALTYQLGVRLARIEASGGPAVTVVSRSDSTLRGHFRPEIEALDRARRDVLGRGYDGVIVCPAFVEAGRVTAGDIHWARSGDRYVPVASTEFARDRAFGYTSSDLRDFIAERTAGAVPAGSVTSISLDDIRRGGPGRVADLLGAARDRRFFVLNAVTNDDLDIAALGITRAQARGRALLLRCAPSLVRAIGGRELSPPLDAARVWPRGRRPGHGAVLVGSHTAAATRQLGALLPGSGMVAVELDVGRVLSDQGRAYTEATARHCAAALAGADVAVSTSRSLVSGRPGIGVGIGNDGLDVARQVSEALARVAALMAKGPAGPPAWVVAKGGITSHDVATRGLGIGRARVLGQVFPGQVSVLAPERASAEVTGMPYVVFPGNVGGDESLRQVVALLREEPA